MASALQIKMLELFNCFLESENLVFLLLCSITMFMKYLQNLTGVISMRNDQVASALSLSAQYSNKKNENEINIPQKAITSVKSKLRKRRRKKTDRKQPNLLLDVISKNSSIPPSSLLKLTDYSLQTKIKSIKLPEMFSHLYLNGSTEHDVMSPLTITTQFITSKNSLLANIRPENWRTEKDIFMRSRFNYNPSFVYSVPMNYRVLNKFKSPSDKYISHAIQILMKVTEAFGSYEAFEEVNGGHLLRRNQIYRVVERYLKADGVSNEITINLCDDLLSQGSLSRFRGKTILNVRCDQMRENWVEGLLRHEIGTHYFRNCNNRYQPWHKKCVRRKLKMDSINPTEEGLASLHSVLFRYQPYLWHPALLYYTTYMASKMSFKELFHDLGKFVKSPSVRWDYCLRAKRGQELTCVPGSFCKDQVYLNGALQLLKRRSTLDFQLLVRLGKVSFMDIDRPCITSIAKLQDTHIPWFMEDMKDYHKKLQNIAFTNGLTDSVLNLVE